MFSLRYFVSLFALCPVATAHAQTQPNMYPVKGGVTLKARAYTDYSDVSKYGLKYASRYDISIAKTPEDGSKWDLTLDERPKDHFGGISSAWYPTTYQNKPTATLRATLHQYEFYDERVTFKNLDLGMEEGTPLDKYPFMFGPKSTAQFMRLSEPQTAKTPSSIAVTLPVQGAETTLGGFNGPMDNSLFVNINVSPKQSEVILTDSPLYKKYGKPVTIQLKTPASDSVLWDSTDNKFNILIIYVPNLKTFKRLDSLPLIVRQRVELQTIPVAIEVPVERPTKKR